MLKSMAAESIGEDQPLNPRDFSKDGMVIRGKETLSGAVCNSYGDHRIAMSMLIAGLFSQGETVVENCACIKTSFPQFMERLQSLMR